MELDLRRFAPGLKMGDNSIWVSRTGAPVSYPSDGNAACFQVEERSFWFQHRNQILVSAVGRFPPPEGMLFDVGGGNGFVARALENAGWTVPLIEPGPVGAANARRSSASMSIVCARLQDVDFHPGSLPAVGLFDVIEHIEDDHLFLTRIHDLLMPGGRVYLTVPAYRWLWSVDDREAGHFRRYTSRTLRASLVGAGLQVEYLSYFFAMLPLPIFVLRAVPSWMKLRRQTTADNVSQEHTGGGTRSALMRKLLNRELGRVGAGQTLAFGSSIVAVARKPPAPPALSL